MGERRRKTASPRAAKPLSAGSPPSGPPARPRRGVDDRPAGGPLFSWRAPSPGLESLASAAWLLPAIIGLALALRVAHLLALGHSPFSTSLLLDARYYDEWAQRIVGGAWIGNAPFWVDPLYAYVLAGLYSVTGHNLMLARLLNFLFGLATTVLVWRLARQVWQSRAAAAAAALMTATCIPVLYFEGQHEKTALTVLLITAAAVLFLSGSLRAIAAAGVVTGLAALARGNALLFVPFAVLCLLLGWDREVDPAGGATAAQRRRRAGVFLACVLPLIGLAMLHNWLATRELVPTTTNLGVNLYLGNHAGNAYGYYEAPAFVRPDTGAELPDFRAEAQRRTGTALLDGALSAYWRGQAWAAIAADPGLAISRTVRKLWLSLHNDEIPDNEDVTMVAEWSPVLRLPVFWLGELLPLGVLGAVIGWRRRGVRLIAAMAAIYVVSLLPFFVMARLRVQLVPLLAVLGGGAVVWLIEAVRRRDRRRLLAAAAIAVPLLFVTFYRPDWMASRRTSSLAIAWNNVGSTQMSAGNRDDAIRAFERAVAIKDTAVPASLRALGDLYRQRGDYLRAEAAMRRVIEIKPQSRSASEALRSLYAVMLQDARWRDDTALRARAAALGGGSPAAAPTDSDPTRAAIAQARTLGSQGRYADAISVLQNAVRNGPYDEDLHYLLGGTMERHAAPADLIAFFSEEVRRDQKPQTSQYFWAVGLARQGNIDGAIAHLRQGLEIDPAHEMSQRKWGELLEQQGQLADALDHYAEAARIHPDFRPALEDAARVAAQLGRGDEAESYRRRAASADPTSVRRFVHWARYLHEHGRDQAAWAEIQRMLKERPADPEALQLRDQIRLALGDAVPPEATRPAPAAAAAVTDRGAPLPAAARATLVARLASEPSAAAWIGYDTRDPAALRMANDLAAVFKEAGWSVPSVAPLGFPVRAGLFLFVADEPSSKTDAVNEALTRAGLVHTVGTGYRAFSAERRQADPKWQGIEFAPGQEFLLVIGRQTVPPS